MFTACLLGLHLATYHFSTPPPEWGEYTAATPGIYVSCDGWTAGALQNSYKNLSVYAAKEWSSGPLFLMLGGISGYTPSAVMPLVAVGVKFHLTEETTARVSFLPKPVHGGSSAAVHLSVEWSF